RSAHPRQNELARHRGARAKWQIRVQPRTQLSVGRRHVTHRAGRDGCSAPAARRSRTRVRPNDIDTGNKRRLTVGLLDPLLFFLAADAKRRLRTRLESLGRDRLLAAFADAERALIDLRERVVDFLEERFLATAQTERERLKILARGEVHFVR